MSCLLIGVLSFVEIIAAEPSTTVFLGRLASRG